VTSLERGLRALFLLACALLGLCIGKAAADPWPARGVAVGNQARAEVQRTPSMGWLGGSFYGECTAITVAVVDAARADGLEASGRRWRAPRDPARPKVEQYHVTPHVRIEDGRWCGYDYWTAGVRYRCAWEERTDPGWWNRVACCRRGLKYLGTESEADMEKSRDVLERRRQAADPGYSAAARSHRELAVEGRGRRLWVGDP